MFSLYLVSLLGCAHTPPESAAAPGATSGRVAAPREPQHSQVYSLRPADGLRAPEGLADAMRQFYDPRVLIGVGRGAGGTRSVMLAAATADGSAQDRCYETTEWPAVSEGPDGALSVSDRALAFGTDGTQGTLAGVSMRAQLKPEGLALIELSGLLDTSALVPRMGGNLAPDAFCTFLPAFGPCLPCPEGAGDTCWSVKLQDVLATPVEVVLEPRDRGAICADPACAEVCGAPAG